MNDKHLPDTSAENPWLPLRQLTPARIALGRTGTSLPTRPQLDFQYAHAQARDAVHLPFDHAAISDGLRQRGRDSLLLHGAAADRHVYLQRPDLGRRLDEASVQRLREHAACYDGQIDLAIVVADGLSALAVQRHTLPFLERLEEQALAEGWSLSPVVLVEQGRVAVADEIGELLRAKMSVILIGERPGLSSPDSLGLYFTWAPRVGLTDAYRNCISNVRLEGLSYGMAAHRLLYLMREACRRQLSGVNLKDEAEVQALDGEAPRTGNFLLARTEPPGRRMGRRASPLLRPIQTFAWIALSREIGQHRSVAGMQPASSRQPLPAMRGPSCESCKPPSNTSTCWRRCSSSTANSTACSPTPSPRGNSSRNACAARSR